MFADVAFQHCDGETSADAERLIAIVERSEWFMSALRAARSLELSSWCIGAGAVRNLVWDKLHGYPVPSALSDVDLAHFDLHPPSARHDAELEATLKRWPPGVPWEVTNQAAVHLWFEGCFGHAVEPLQSLSEAIASWPEYATCVGVVLNADDSLAIIAPYGLNDLFNMVVRRNPARVSVETYGRRCREKRYVERWPNSRVLPP